MVSSRIGRCAWPNEVSPATRRQLEAIDRQLASLENVAARESLCRRRARGRRSTILSHDCGRRSGRTIRTACREQGHERDPTAMHLVYPPGHGVRLTSGAEL